MGRILLQSATVIFLQNVTKVYCKMRRLLQDVLVENIRIAKIKYKHYKQYTSNERIQLLKLAFPFSGKTFKHFIVIKHFSLNILKF